jgi:CspA family cold shock protein
MADREMGTVKWFNNVRGYGFITRGEGSEDIFVHYRNIRADGYRSLAEGQNVEFQLQQGEKGLQAEDVVLHGYPGLLQEYKTPAWAGVFVCG